MENQATERTTGSDLQIFYSPAPNTPNPIDIVADHGLNGHPTKSWTHTTATRDSTLWLKDLLPTKLPGARVMTFGYEASVIGNTSVHGVRENAKKLLAAVRDRREDNDDDGRPIVFIVHSLGGILAKQALKLANSDGKRSGIAGSTKGIVFFGTPHRGADAAKWARLVLGIAATAFHQPQQKFLGVLETHSAGWMKISEDFRLLASKYAITSVYEQDAHPVLGTVKLSAVLGLPHEDDMIMDGNHSTMSSLEREIRALIVYGELLDAPQGDVAKVLGSRCLLLYLAASAIKNSNA
ncbi:hypothetical protein DL768_002750 [Monosporascus sp. mg162]|nr:hypothetical protein DL768_002750 [Monosporascus sp. mg162]